MHRIGPDRSDVALDEKQKLERELQKSLWIFLCNQDWFNIPFANAHAISPAHCTTPVPLNCDGISGLSQNGASFKAEPMDKPTQMTYMLDMFQGLSCDELRQQQLMQEQWPMYAEAFSTRRRR